MEAVETCYSGEEAKATRRAPSYALSGRRSLASFPAGLWQAIARSTAVNVAAASVAASMEAAPGRESEAEVDAGYLQKTQAPDVSALASPAGATRGLDVKGCVTNCEVAVD